MTTNATIKNSPGSRNNIEVHVRGPGHVAKHTIAPGEEAEVVLHDSQDVRITEGSEHQIVVETSAENVASISEPGPIVEAVEDGATLSDEAALGMPLFASREDLEAASKSESTT